MPHGARGARFCREIVKKKTRDLMLYRPSLTDGSRRQLHENNSTYFELSSSVRTCKTGRTNPVLAKAIDHAIRDENISGESKRGAGTN